MYLSVRGNTEMLPAIVAAADRRAALRGAPSSPLRVATFSFELLGHSPTAKTIVDGIPIYVYTFHGGGKAR